MEHITLLKKAIPKAFANGIEGVGLHPAIMVITQNAF